MQSYRPPIPDLESVHASEQAAPRTADLSPLFSADGDPLPTVSLLVCMRNEARQIRGCLQSIIMQDYPVDKIEVVVMDGCSSDGSSAIVEEIQARAKNVRLIRNPRIIQAAGWNLGIAACKGDVIGIVSGHSELAPDYVSRAVDALRRTRAAMVGGPTRTAGETFISRLIGVAQSSAFGIGTDRSEFSEETEVDTVFMGVCRRELYVQLGGFDENMVRNQDDELSYRVRKCGGRIICSPLIRSLYYNRSTLSGLWRQYFQYGLWKVRVLQLHPKQMKVRHFVPASFVSLLLLLGFLAIAFSLALNITLAVVALYLFVGLLAGGRVAKRCRRLEFALVSAIFPILHVAYGTGFLFGMIRFRHCWRTTRGTSP